MAENESNAPGKPDTEGMSNFSSALTRPYVAFWLGIVVLVPVQLWSVSRSEWFSAPPKPVGDGLDYENIGFHLAIGEGYAIDNQNPTWRAVYEAEPERYAQHLEAPPRNLWATGRPPTLPTLVAAIYSCLGRGPAAFATIRLVLACSLAVSGAISAYWTARMVNSCAWRSATRRSDLAAQVAVLCTIGLAALNNTLKTYATDFLTEPIALLLTQLFVCLILSASLNEQRLALGWRLAGMGVCIGMLILTRSIFIVWLPGLWFVCFMALRSNPQDSDAEHTHAMSRSLRSGVPALGVVALGLLCCAPWWTRNVQVLDAWMPLGTQGPVTLLGGYSAESLAGGGDWQPQPEQRLRAKLRQSAPATATREQQTVHEVEIARAARQQLRLWLADNWRQLPTLLLARLTTHWNPYSGKSLAWKVLILLGLIALFVWRHPARWLCVALPLTSTVVAMALYTTGGRFLVPLYGLLFTLSGCGTFFVLSALLGQTKQLNQSIQPTPSNGR